MTTEKYLEWLRDEGCTYTEVFRETDDPDLPAIVHHDGDTCPIHEASTREETK